MSQSRLYTSEGYDDSYKVTSVIGEGSFGVVLKAVDLQTNRIVAIKRIPLKRNRRNEIELIREIFALRNAQHRNIVKVLDEILTPDTVSLVMEYVESSLKLAIEDFNRPLNDEIPRYYMFQLFTAVDYLHSLHIMHRDLKPDNILITSTGLLKVTDFGQCCIYVPDDLRKDYDCQVGSRWYRAPELLFGSTKYDPKVDEWACGCIFTEFYNGGPLFTGRNDIEQMGKLISVLGTPCERNWKDWSIIPDCGKVLFKDNESPPSNWNEIVPLASEDCLSLLHRLLVYSSEERFSAKEALQHEFFIDSIPEEAPYVPPLMNSETLHQQDALELDLDGSVEKYFRELRD